MAKVDLTPDNRIVIDIAFREKDLVKQVPGAKYDADTRRWYTHVSWGACQALRGVFGPDLEIGEALAGWAWRELNERVTPALALHGAADATVGIGGGFWDEKLFPYQRAAVAFGIFAERFLNASEMGVGKTVETIATLVGWQEKNGDALPAVIVCTNSMKRTWRREFRAWAPHLRTAVVKGGRSVKAKQILQAATGETDVIIINWEALRGHSRIAPYGSIRLKRCQACGGDGSVKETSCEVHVRELNEVQWRTVIADEAHKAKSARAQQTRALWALAHNSQSRYRIGLTGTPIANAPDDLWSIMHYVAPEDWPHKTRYIDRYCLTSWNTFGGLDIVGVRPDTRDEFYRILDPRFIRHIKAIVLPQLPPKPEPQERIVELTPKQKKAYDKMSKDMLAELEGGTIAATSPLAKATRLSQFAAAYAEVGPDGRVVLTEPSCKVDALVELIEEAGGKPLVAFAESRQLIELCERRLEKLKIPYLSIHGEIAEHERELAKEKFQQGDVPVILLTLGAGGEGLTLTAADTVVFLQRSWSMLKNKQAEDRIHRIGQTAERIQIINVLAEGTLEETREYRLAQKEGRLEEITRDQQALKRMLEFDGGNDDE